MKIKGPGTLARLAHTFGILQLAYGRDGDVAVKKWPRKRPGELPPITQQQVKIWDQAQVDVKYPEPREFIDANKRSQGTAFYARDILIMAMYGHYLSWPGWGPYPNGLSKANPGGEEPDGEVKCPHALGDIQPTNSIDKWEVSFDHFPETTITVTTKRSTTPELAVWQCDPIDIPKRIGKLGTVVNHGNKLWLPCDPDYFLPVPLTGKEFVFTLPAGISPGGQFPTWGAMIMRATAPCVNWSSLLHAIPPD